MPGNLKA